MESGRWRLTRSSKGKMCSIYCKKIRILINPITTYEWSLIYIRYWKIEVPQTDTKFRRNLKSPKCQMCLCVDFEKKTAVLTWSPVPARWMQTGLSFRHLFGTMNWNLKERTEHKRTDLKQNDSGFLLLSRKYGIFIISKGLSAWAIGDFFFLKPTTHIQSKTNLNTYTN